MLDRDHRIVRGDDYRAVVRRGRRAPTPLAVIYATATSGPSRFGFIVAKTVGNAVVRNRMRRRLKSIAASYLAESDVGISTSGHDIVIRALPGSASASWATLNSTIGGALRERAWSKGKARA